MSQIIFALFYCVLIFGSDIHACPRNIFWLSRVARQVVGVAILNKTYRGYGPPECDRKEVWASFTDCYFDLYIHAAQATNYKFLMNCPLSYKF